MAFHFFLLQNYRSFTKSLNDVPIIMVAYLIKYQIRHNLPL